VVARLRSYPDSVSQTSQSQADDAASLRALRLAEGLTLTAAAERTGYSFTHLSNVERGVRRISPDVARAYRLLDGTSVTPRPAVQPDPADFGKLSGPSGRGQAGRTQEDFGVRLMRLRLERGWSLT